MQDIILLHGAIGSREQLIPLEKALQNKFRVHNLDLPGHGQNTDATETFSIEYFSKFLSAYINDNSLTDCNIFGYSLGGYVAMHYAAHTPEFGGKIMTLGTKFFWDESIAEAEVKMLDPETILKKVPTFAEELILRHKSGWKQVLMRTSELLTRMGIHNSLQVIHFQSINAPCLIMQGDRDKMVTMAETVAVYKILQQGELAILPASHHAIEKIAINIVDSICTEFCFKS